MKTRKSLSLPVALIITIVVLLFLAYFIATGMGVFKSKKTGINNTLQGIDTTINYQDCYEYVLYDGTSVNGSEIIDLINSNDVKDKEICIRVKTLAATSTTDYVRTLTGPTDGKYSLASAVGSTTIVTTKSNVDYINPSGTFKCTALYDKNDSLVGLQFDQK